MGHLFTQSPIERHLGCFQLLPPILLYDYSYSQMPTCQCICLRMPLCGLTRPKTMWLSNTDGCYQRSSEDNQFTFSPMMQRLNRPDIFTNGIRPLRRSVDFSQNNYTLQTNCNFQPFSFQQTFILCVWH